MEQFRNKISDLKQVETKDNIETYEAKMKISIKLIKAKNEKELIIYNQILISNKKDWKIYDIIEDNKNNILCVIYDSNQDINELLNPSYIHIYKEAIVKGHIRPTTFKEISQLFKKEDSMCRIKFKKIIKNKLESCIGSAFFLEFHFNEIPFNKCLITNNHILDKQHIQTNKEIKIIYKNEEKNIIITKERRTFTDKKLDYTCIEIINEDYIKDFFKIDENIIENDPKIFEEQDIFILQFPKGNDLSFSSGKILKADDSNMIHNCSTEGGSSGSPIISRDSDFSIIGLHYGSYSNKKHGEKSENDNFNLCSNIISIINDIKKQLNKNINEAKIHSEKQINIKKTNEIKKVIQNNQNYQNNQNIQNNHNNQNIQNNPNNHNQNNKKYQNNQNIQNNQEYQKYQNIQNIQNNVFLDLYKEKINCQGLNYIENINESEYNLDFPPNNDINCSFTPLIGLQNIGAINYMNATLQCFCHIEKFVKLFKKNENIISKVRNNKYSLTASFKLLIEKLRPNYYDPSTSKKYYAPHEFKIKISSMNPLFNEKAGNDPKEFIIFIIMTLHEELNKTNIYNKLINDNILDHTNKNLMFETFRTNFAAQNLSIISDLFYAANCNITQCQSCKKTTYDYQTYFFIEFSLEEVLRFKFEKKLNNFSLFDNDNTNFNLLNSNNNKDNVINLYDCFNYYKKSKIIFGNKDKCNFCKQICNKIMTTNLTTGPNILILLLNRRKDIKFDLKIDFQENLDLYNFIEYKEPGYKYELIGVITHIGKSNNDGIFVAYCKDLSSGGWYKYVDAIVSKINDFKNEVINSIIPYILFYQKI